MQRADESLDVGLEPGDLLGVGSPQFLELTDLPAQALFAVRCATPCNLAVHHRTDILLYEDAGPTPTASRDQLRRAGDEMKRAATTYRAVAQPLSRRPASAAARREDQQLIVRALADEPEKASAAARLTPLPAPVAQPTAHTRR
ncbi:hypothetical protein SUDANB176_00206 [Streptomyces sp. enrichment culture]|uniref:hypothetical protein n=1 Tax=Streptomyces sp. enrichment culture TaxID=1795815 RepID=UPI003F55179B